MYVEDHITGFYNVIGKEKVLIFVNYDIDAICAAKILQSLFRYDSIVYTLIPVSTISDLITGYEDHKQNIKYVILINCGGTIDIVEKLEPEMDVIIFIADNHRPTDICNVYSNFQVRMLCQADTDEVIPDFDDIYREDEDDDEFNDDYEDDGVNEESILRKQEKRLWIENKKRILFEYVQFSYYGRSSAILLYELSWHLHRDNFDLLWWGIIGVAEQFILGKVEILQYLNEVEKISAHIGRLCSHIPENSDDTQSQNSVTSFHNNHVNTALRIDCEKDLQLALYRHWTVESSLQYTMYTAVALRLWAIKGKDRIQQLMVEMGLPLAESRQQYSAMDLHFRKEFHAMMEKMSNTRKLTHITYPSFTILEGFRTKYQAADYVYSMLALLSDNNRKRSMRDCFYDAMDALSRTKKDLLDDGIEKSKTILTCMFKHVQSALDTKQIKSAGPFFYLVIEEGTLHSKYYANPDCLWCFATFALRAYVAACRRSHATILPLIASAPLEDDYCLVIGVPPVAESTPRSSCSDVPFILPTINNYCNEDSVSEKGQFVMKSVKRRFSLILSFFGKAFEQVAEKTGRPIALDYFDSNVVKMRITDRSKVFDALVVLLSS